MAGTAARPPKAAGQGLKSSRALLVGASALFAVAAVARLVPIVRGGGLTGFNRYDDGVDFAGALGLVHGRLPYRDFLWLHPPGIQLVLAPFAALAYLIGEPASFVVVRLAFVAAGGLTAVLIGRLLWPVGRIAAISGGLLYALFWPAIVSTHRPSGWRG